jgi:PAS domain S-box-containing protein
MTTPPVPDSAAAAKARPRHDLEHTEAWFRSTFEHAAVGIAHVAPDGRFLAVNDRFCGIVGHAREALLAAGFQRITHPQDLAEDEANVTALLEDRVAHYTMEKRYLRGDGTTVWVELTVGLVRDACGQPLHFVSVIQDIRARKALEDAQARTLRELQETVQRLHRSEAEARRVAAVLEQVLESSPDPIWTKDLQGRWTLVNSAAAAVIGRPRQDLVGLRDRDVLPPQFADGVEAQDRSILEGGEHIEVEETLFDVHRGEPRHFLSTKAPMRAEDGRITGLIGVARDITERRAAREWLRIAAVAFESQDGLAITDERCVMLRVNPALCALTGHADDELVGQDVALLMADSRNAVTGAAGLRQLAHAGRWQGEVWCRRKDGEAFAGWLGVSAVTDRTGRITHYVVALADISQRKRAQAALLQSQLDLSRLAQRLMEQEQILVQRLAQLLQEGLGQTLSAMTMHIEMLEGGNAARALPEPLQRSALTLRRLGQRAIEELRGAMAELRPPRLGEQGLVAALRQALPQSRPEQPGVAVDVVAGPSLQSLRWPPEVEHAFFMVAREALDNAVRHAGAQHVECLVAGEPHWLRLQVCNDGRIDHDSPRQPGHLSVVSMRERALAIGARLEFKQLAGTRACVQLEWENLNDDAALPG